MRTRCKFVVQTVEQQNHKLFDAADTNRATPIGFAEKVKLLAQYDSEKNPEDVSFADSTPCGSLEIYVCNPSVVGGFKPGDAFYLDLTPCAEVDAERVAAAA